MDNCIFCKIIAGEIPSATVYEDDDFKAIMDIGPAAKGHVIILSKRHMANIYEIEEQTASRALLVASKIARAQKEALGCDGVNILQNNEEAAGQTVFHLHIHVIPRFKNDGVTIPWKNLSYPDGEAAIFAEKIKAAIK